jgi:hypothetical protein
MTKSTPPYPSKVPVVISVIARLNMNKLYGVFNISLFFINNTTRRPFPVNDRKAIIPRPVRRATCCSLAWR